MDEGHGLEGRRPSYIAELAPALDALVVPVAGEDLERRVLAEAHAEEAVSDLERLFGRFGLFGTSGEATE